LQRVVHATSIKCSDPTWYFPRI